MSNSLSTFKIQRAAGNPSRMGRTPWAARYAGAESNNLNADFPSLSLSANAALEGSVEVLRNRSRSMERDNPLTNRWLTLLENNVLGSGGVRLQMRVREPDRYIGGKVLPGVPDELANRSIESAWRDWGRKRWAIGMGKISWASYSGDLSWLKIQKLALRSTKRDGSCFAIIHIDAANPYGMSLQLLEADYLDIRLNAELSNGNKIRMGIEKDTRGRRVAWHLYKHHPADRLNWSANATMERVRVPADKCIHLFDPKRIEQHEGVPDNHPVLMRMRMLEGYDEAELVAARVGAAKQGFFKRNLPEGMELPEDANGIGIYEAEAGAFDELPPGVDLVPWDPKHPNTAYPEFTKSAKRDIAAGLNLSYNGFANDLEGVNYSSIRAGVLEDREQYMGLQNWFIDEFVGPIFEQWLYVALLKGAIKMPNGSPLPFAKLDKFNAPQHVGRRWPWVDPEKDMKAHLLAINGRFKSLRGLIAENGGDITDIFSEQEADNQLAAQHNLSPVTPGPMADSEPGKSEPSHMNTETDGEE